MKKLRFRIWLLLILSILPLLCLAAVLLLPSMVEFAVNQILKRSAARGYIVCDISQITPFSANVSMNARQKTESGRFRRILSLPHCGISYTPLSLLRGRINGLTITGATIPVVIEDKKIMLPIMEMFQFARRENEFDIQQAPAKVPHLGMIRIENGALSVRFGGKVQYIPVSMTVRQVGTGWKKVIVKGRIHLNGQTIAIREAVIDLENHTAVVDFLVRDTILNNLPHPFDLYANDLELQGNMTADIQAKFNYASWKMEHIKSRLAIRNFSMNACGRRIFSKLLNYNLDFNGKTGSLVLENIDFESFHLNRSQTDFSVTKNKLAGKSILMLKFPEKKASEFEFNFTVSGDPLKKSAQLDVTSVPDKKYELVFDGINTSFTSLALQLKASLERQAVSFMLKTAEFSFDGKKVSAEKIEAVAEHAAGAVSGSVQGKVAKAVDSATALSAENIAFDLPFKIGGSAKGKLAVGTVSFREKPLGKVEASAVLSLGNSLRKNRFSVSGIATALEFPDVSVLFRSENELADSIFLSRNTFELPETTIPALDPGKFAKELSTVKLSGKMKASGAYVIDSRRGSSSGYLKTALSNVSVTDAPRELALSGVNLNFELPSLPVLRSSPGMKVTVDSIRLGGIKINDFFMIYRMESPKIWTVEAIKADWASGVVRMEFTRLDLTKKIYELILHCDRLNLSEILIQFGQGTAKGEGTLNGTLPITITPGNIIFHDGFLNSTPGEIGSLKLSQTDYLTAGVPKELPQYTQLKFSQDVLKDFSYDWVKLNIASKKDILTLQMKISGKPAHPLPYRYDGGTLVQVKTLTDFEGVRLDVNFSLPLEKILNIIDNLKKLSGDKR